MTPHKGASRCEEQKLHLANKQWSIFKWEAKTLLSFTGSVSCRLQSTCSNLILVLQQQNVLSHKYLQKHDLCSVSRLSCLLKQGTLNQLVPSGTWSGGRPNAFFYRLRRSVSQVEQYCSCSTNLNVVSLGHQRESTQTERMMILHSSSAILPSSLPIKKR